MFDLSIDFPYQAIRPIQLESLRVLESNWEKFDVFVLQAPTAYGKTAVARTLMNAFHSVSVITPTNLLVHQFLDEFPDTPTLHRMDSYWCDKWKRPCPITRSKLLQFCSQKRDDHACACSSDLATAKYRTGPGIYNYHTYLAHKLYRDVLVVDEAHNLLPVIRERQAIKLWQHDYKYPNNMWSNEQISEWFRGLGPKLRAHKKMQALSEAVTYSCPKYIVKRCIEEFNGKGTVRGQPELRDCLKLLPVDISDAPPMFWPRDVKKVVLMSATIGKKDIEAVGLGRGRKICYINCKSPIPFENRPIVALDVASVNRQNMTSILHKLAEEIQNVAQYHSQEKGVIHATYQMSSLLQRELIGSPIGSRLMFHTRENKKQVYEAFRECPDPKILVGCGLYEGIDLPEDLGRWQIIAKIPWMSLGDPAIKHLSELDPEWYVWETLKTTIQACGRICRTPEDFGITYVLDTTFRRLLSEGQDLIPEWFQDAIRNI